MINNMATHVLLGGVTDVLKLENIWGEGGGNFLKENNYFKVSNMKGCMNV